ncbi:hypothetical protein [Amycolatopsis solani]|uniref:hypothetical protein n=1 Tax=Amycolatopsis solani TaxID=3028615 RepID=UPI0025AEF483|nr:hypothetical protein [Amycolatopsis sp. MEP2-6]
MSKLPNEPDLPAVRDTSTRKSPNDCSPTPGKVRFTDRIVETLAMPPLLRSGPQVAPLPVPELEPLVDSAAAGFALVRVDASGAIASKSVVALLGWSRATPISYDVRSGLIVTCANSGARHRVPAKLNLVLPAQIRARCRVRAEGQVLLAALIEHELLVIYPQRRLYDMVITYHASLQPEPASFR